MSFERVLDAVKSSDGRLDLITREAYADTPDAHPNSSYLIKPIHTYLHLSGKWKIRRRKGEWRNLLR